MTPTVKPSDQGLGAEIEGVDFSQPIADETHAALIDGKNKKIVSKGKIQKKKKKKKKKK